MPNFGMAEQYGIPCTDVSKTSWDERAKRHCPFIDSMCNKKGGVCSITDGATLTLVCPHRFKERGVLYSEIAKTAFGSSQDCVAVNEVAFLEGVDGNAVGNIDNVVVKLARGAIVDWCAVEIQAVYFSGSSMEKEIRAFEQTRMLPTPASRRPDYRSSGPKRLLPQLETKVPTLRRWGKKMFVAIDQAFFDWMPRIGSVSHISNADICWIVVALDVTVTPYSLSVKKTVFATLEDSRIGLVAGTPPSIPEFEKRVLEKCQQPKNVVWGSYVGQET